MNTSFGVATALTISVLAPVLTAQRKERPEPVDAYVVKDDQITLDWFNMLNESGGLAYERFWTGTNALFQVYKIHIDKGRFNEFQAHFRAHQKRIHKLLNSKMAIPWFNQLKMLVEDCEAQAQVVDVMATMTREAVSKLKSKRRLDRAARKVVADLEALEKSWRDRHKMLLDAIVTLKAVPTNPVITAAK